MGCAFDHCAQLGEEVFGLLLFHGGGGVEFGFLPSKLGGAFGLVGCGWDVLVDGLE